MEFPDLDPVCLNCADVLADVDVEVDRRLVAGALVERRGNHYRIESGDETSDELEALVRRSAGHCECGWPLSRLDDDWHCRRCD